MQVFFLVRHAAFLLFLMTSGGCIAADKQQQDLEALLQKSFNQIFLAIGGLEYPYSVKHLNKCIKCNYKECLDVYNRVLAGKKTIKSQNMGVQIAAPPDSGPLRTNGNNAATKLLK